VSLVKKLLSVSSYVCAIREMHFLSFSSSRITCLEFFQKIRLITLSEFIFITVSLRPKRMSVHFEDAIADTNHGKAERIFPNGPRFRTCHAPLIFNLVLDAKLNGTSVTRRRSVPITRGKRRILLESIERAVGVEIVERCADSST